MTPNVDNVISPSVSNVKSIMFKHIFNIQFTLAYAFLVSKGLFVANEAIDQDDEEPPVQAERNWPLDCPETDAEVEEDLRLSATICSGNRELPELPED